MRRAIARHKLKQLQGAKEDLALLLKQNPNHKKAKELIVEVNEELAKTTTQPAAKTSSSSSTNKRRIKIEEVNEPAGEVDCKPLVTKQPTLQDAASGSHDAAKGSHEAPQVSHDAPESKPVTTQPLPVHVVKLKDQGNKLFQAGQYGEALDCYSNAINSVQRSTYLSMNLVPIMYDRVCHIYELWAGGELSIVLRTLISLHIIKPLVPCFCNSLLFSFEFLCVLVEGLDCNPADVAVLFSNRAACYLKIGDCHGCVKDCTTSIAMAPANSYKPLLRRALAYETMEKLVNKKL